MRQERDPVERVRKLLVAKGYDAAQLKVIEKATKKEVDSAVEESKVWARHYVAWLILCVGLLHVPIFLAVILSYD